MLVSRLKHWEFAVYTFFSSKALGVIAPPLSPTNLLRRDVKRTRFGFQPANCVSRDVSSFSQHSRSKKKEHKSSNLVSDLIDFIDLMNSFGANLQMSSMSYSLNVEKEKGSGCSIARDKKSSPTDKRRPQIPIAQPARITV